MIETLMGKRMSMAKQTVSEASHEMNKLIGATLETDMEAVMGKMMPFSEVNTCIQGLCGGAYREMQLYLRVQPGHALQVDFSQTLVTLMSCLTDLLRRSLEGLDLVAG